MTGPDFETLTAINQTTKFVSMVRLVQSRRWARAWKKKAKVAMFDFMLLSNLNDYNRDYYQEHEEAYKARIQALEEGLRPLVVQWEECVKLERESWPTLKKTYEEAEYISIPVANKAMRQVRALLSETPKS